MSDENIDADVCMVCDLPVTYDEEREDIDDDKECLRTKPLCSNKHNAADWRTRAIATERLLVRCCHHVYEYEGEDFLFSMTSAEDVAAIRALLDKYKGDKECGW